MAKISLRDYKKEIETLIDRGRLEEAIAHAKYILSTYSKHIDSYRLLGKAFLEARRYKDAGDIFQRVLSSVPDDIISHIGMSIFKEDTGDLDSAIWHMERAFETQPSNKGIQTEMKRLYGRRDGVEPVKLHLSKGALVRMYARSHLYSQAITEALSALAEDPSRVDIEITLAQMYYLSRQKREATEISSRVVSKLPFCFEANRILSEVLTNTSRTDEATNYRDRVISLDPYYAYISDKTPESKSVPDDAVMIDHFSWQTASGKEKILEWSLPSITPTEPQAAPPTDWLSTARQELAKTEDEKPTQPQEHQAQPGLEEAIPDWMKTDDWQPSENPPKTEPQVGIEEDKAVPAEIPSWLKMFTSTEPPTAEEILPPTPQNIPEPYPPFLVTPPVGLAEHQVENVPTQPFDISPSAAENLTDVPEWLRETAIGAVQPSPAKPAEDKPLEIAVPATAENASAVPITQEPDTKPPWLREIKADSELELKPSEEIPSAPVPQTPEDVVIKLPRLKKKHARRQINWSLTGGLVIVVSILLLAIAGPLLAPHDPMQENYALEANGRIHSPPYLPLEVKGYPLGTDDFGRDMLSRILWGIQPTLLMVVIVAVVRLVLAIIIGMIAGWSSGRAERFFGSLISSAVSLPVLIVALIGISAIGIQRGLLAFIFGLAITGWAETAHLVSTKTREIKNLAYIEVARALGASDFRILFMHILRQILPMIWMMLSIEISSTLLVTAELGYLGYFVGGGVWIEIFDFQAVRTSGFPELGQIIATSVKNLTKPMILVVTGSLILIIVLGFNLLGDGLRREMAIGYIGSHGRNPLWERFTGWVDWKFMPAVGAWFKKRTVRAGAIILLVALVGGLLWSMFHPRGPSADTGNLGNPGGHYWATEFGNSQGTRYVPFSGPTDGTIVWQQKPTSSFNGGPVVAADGTIYAAGQPDGLFAFDPNGNLIWQVPLTVTPVGTPALGAEGQIYVSDRDGGLSCYSPDGEFSWRFAPTGGRSSTSGPIVSREGTIYYTRLDSIQAVSPDGDPLWNTVASNVVLDDPPRLSPLENLLMIKTALVGTSDGSVYDTQPFLDIDPVTIYSDPAFFVGANDILYFRVGHGAVSWDFIDNQFTIGEKFSWDPHNPQVSYPSDAGVNGHGLLWLFYGSPYRTDLLSWLDLESGEGFGVNHISNLFLNMVGMDENDLTFLCVYGSGRDCYAIRPSVDEPVWQVDFPEGKPRLDANAYQVWGALAPGRLYVTTLDGYLYAIGNKQEPSQ